MAHFRNVCVFLSGESSKAFASDPSSSERKMSNLFVVIVLIIYEKVKNTQIQKSKKGKPDSQLLDKSVSVVTM